MPITIRQRKPNGYVVLSVQSPGGNTDGVSLNGPTNGANASADEVVQSMSIAEIMWSIDGASTFDVKRGSNTVLQLAGSGHHDYQHSAMRLEASEAQLTSNLNIESSGTGTVVVKLHKVSGE